MWRATNQPSWLKLAATTAAWQVHASHRSPLQRHQRRLIPFVAGVEVDEAFEFDTVWAPLGDVDSAGVMDDDEWFNEVHDGHEKVWGEEQQQYKDVCSALIDVGPVKRLELGAAACKVKPATPSSSSFRRSSARDSTCRYTRLQF